MTTKMSDEEAYQWDKLITRAARFVASDFPDVEFEDITQKFWVELLSLKNRPNVYTPGVASIVARRLKKHAWDVRKDQLLHSSQYLYRTSDVRIILETIFFKEEWANGFVPDDARAYDGLHHMDAVDIRADVSWAFEGLADTYKAAIISRYVGQKDPTVERERKKLNRAIARLTDLLNTYYRGHKPKKALSNAAAMALIEDQEGS